MAKTITNKRVDMIIDILSLIGHRVEIKEVESWSAKRRQKIVDWACRKYLGYYPKGLKLPSPYFISQPCEVPTITQKELQKTNAGKWLRRVARDIAEEKREHLKKVEQMKQRFINVT